MCRERPKRALFYNYSLPPTLRNGGGFSFPVIISNNSNISNKTNKNYILLLILLELQNIYYICPNE